jgi:uncharacterized protein (TIGR03790 family)
VPAIAGAVLIGALDVSAASAQDGRNVLVIMNIESEDSKPLATRYAKARGVPAEQILSIRTGTADDIERRHYDLDIEIPIAEWLSKNTAQDRIHYIVLTKGVPLRIRGSGGLNGTVASVDSELSLLYRKLLGVTVAPVGRVPNPYFHAEAPIVQAKPFSHEFQDTFLVTRIDAFTLDSALRLIDRGASPVRQGKIVLDRQGSAAGDRGGDGWLSAAADTLLGAGFAPDDILLNTTSEVVRNQKPVLGYYSWGSNDPAIKTRRFDLGFVPGSIAAMYVSSDGRTFKQPPETWTVGTWPDRSTHFENSPQSLAGDLIEEGATGVAGHVAEPFLDATIRPQILFPAYVRGFNLAESFYLAMPFLSWQTVVVGDPLCRPFDGAVLSSAQLAPALDPETELPRYFSARRLAALRDFGVRTDVAKLMLKANARLMHSDLEGAKAALEAVTVLEPQLNAAHFVLAGIYEQSREYDKAIDRYRRILSSAPNNVRSLNNLAYVLATQKNELAESLPMARYAYDLSSKDELEVDLGYAMIARRGTPAGSLPFAMPAYNLLAFRGQVADTLGWIYHLSGDHLRAQKLIEEAVAGDPDNGIIQFHLAAVEAAAGRLERAREVLSRALALDPALTEDPQVLKLQQDLK